MAEVKGRSVRRGKEAMVVSLKSEPMTTPGLNSMSPQTDILMEPHLTP